MDPQVWGPGAWKFLHSVTLQYPLKPTYTDKKNYADFFTMLQYVLPCPTCQEHYKKNLKMYPIQTQSRDKLVEWLVHIHNQVNLSNGKRMWSLDEFYKHYQELYTFRAPFTIYHLLMILVGLCILYTLWKYVNRPQTPPF